MADLDNESGAGEQPVAEREITPIPEQIRDDHGRFAPKERQQPEGETDAPQEQGGDEQQPERQQMVPHQALHAAREEAKALKEQSRAFEAQLAEIRAQNQFLMQQYGQRPAQPQPEPQPAPDWYQDPDAAFKHHVSQALNPVQQSLAQQRESFSQMLAIEKFGHEAVQTAEAELRQLAQSDPQSARYDYQRIMASPHPYGELVAWHKQRATLNRVGSDPDAFIQAEVERRLAEMGHQPAPQTQAATPQPRNPLANMPSSMASARNGGPRGSAQATGGARSLSEIMGR